MSAGAPAAARPLAFELPPALVAETPPEWVGGSRSAVRLMVARRRDRSIEHRRFADLPELLAPGDLVVVNTSATLPASLPARRPDGERLDLHLSTPLPGGDPEREWVVELRTPERRRFTGGRAGEELLLPAGGRARLVARRPPGGTRLWEAELELPGTLLAYLERHGRPIRYAHSGDWPMEAYQTAFALEPGSAEMPSAARPFTPAIVAALVTRGIAIAPLVLHTGISSLERGEPPAAERYRVPPHTAAAVNGAHAGGGRVIAVGTTVVRALETVAGDDGEVATGEGWTERVVTPERGLRAVDGLVTGWHEPEGSHLLLVEAAAGRELAERSYAAALASGYRWHELGDSHLILP